MRGEISSKVLGFAAARACGLLAAFFLALARGRAALHERVHKEAAGSQHSVRSPYCSGKYQQSDAPGCFRLRSQLLNFETSGAKPNLGSSTVPGAAIFEHAPPVIS
jgi:hypothetical protein